MSRVQQPAVIEPLEEERARRRGKRAACASCGMRQSDDERNRRLQWCGAPVCVPCKHKWESVPPEGWLSQAQDIVGSYTAKWNMLEVLEQCQAFQELDSPCQWETVAKTLAERARQTEVRSRGSSKSGARRWTGLVDDARLCRLFGRELDGEALQAMRNLIRFDKDWTGLYAAFTHAEACAARSLHSQQQPVASVSTTATTSMPNRGDLGGLVLYSLTLRGGFFAAHDALAAAETSRQARRTLECVEIWAAVALGDHPELNANAAKMRCALDWRSALHFAQLESRRRHGMRHRTQTTAKTRQTQPTALAASRLLREAREMLTRAPAGLSATPISDDNMLAWRATVAGPDASAYQGAKFRLHLDIPYDYPYSPPSVYFITRVFHPNVDIDSGRVCVDLLEPDHWSSAASIRVVLLSLQSLLASPTALDSARPANIQAAQAMRNNLPFFRAQAAASVKASLDFVPSPKDKAMERSFNTGLTTSHDEDCVRAT